ncbi:MAG: SH3 domain-containing protein, partial [Bacteroidales bacterium]|nr:SH3 domain-containing protein [Bacteroidales bacterium]
MRIKRTLAALLGCLTLAASCASPVYAYTGEETTDTTAGSATSETAATTSDTASANQSLPYSVTTDKDGNVILSIGDQKWTFDLSEETRRIGTVQVNSYLHLRTGAGMSYDIIGYLKPGQQVEVIGDAGDWYKVTIPEQTGYVHGDYLRVSEQTVDNKLDEDSLALLLALLAQNQSTTGTTGGTSSSGNGTNTGVSLTPPGNLT